MRPEMAIVPNVPGYALRCTLSLNRSILVGQPIPTMHSIYARINGISSLWSTCMMVLLASVTLSSFVFTANATGRIDVASLKVSVRPFFDQMHGLRSLMDVIPSPSEKHHLIMDPRYADTMRKQNVIPSDRKRSDLSSSTLLLVSMLLPLRPPVVHVFTVALSF